MTLKVALMRSIIVGGERVKMAEVRALVGRVAGSEVRSVIATGNLLFRSRKAPGALVREIEAALAERYGRPTEMVVKTAGEWRALLDANPFPKEAEAAPARLLAWAMREPLPDSGLEQLRARARGEERVERVASGDFYVWFGQGNISDSKITAGFGLKQLGAVGTNRNWNTCQKIALALEAMDG